MGNLPSVCFQSWLYKPHDPDNSSADGTLRWQAPELMAGGNSKFLAPMDVYAFAICCVEILTKGSLPWPLLDDEAVRHLVLSTFAFIRRPQFANHHL